MFLKSVQTPECFVCFVALHPKSKAMVMAGRSVHLTTPECNILTEYAKFCFL